MIRKIVERLECITNVDYTNLKGTFYKSIQVRNLSASESYRALLETQEDEARFQRYDRWSDYMAIASWITPGLLGFGAMAAYEISTGHKVPAEVAIPVTLGVFGTTGSLMAASFWFGGRVATSQGKLRRLRENLQKKIEGKI